MVEFFHGWRRKAGCVTLFMALLFCGMSVRSRWVADTLMVDRHKGGRHYVTSNRDGLTWGRRWGSGQRVHLSELMNIGWESNDRDSSEFYKPGNGWSVDSKLEFCGLQFAKFLLTDDIPTDCWNWHFFGIPIVSYTTRSNRPTGDSDAPIVLSLVLGGLSIWTFPYWLFTVPLTVVSFLLLRKPAKSIRTSSRSA